MNSNDRRPPHARSSGLGALVAPLLFSAVFAAGSAPGVPAHAVPPEYLRGLALHPSDPQRFVLRYESAFGGLLFSQDGGKSLQMLPGQSFSRYDLRRFVPMLMMADGKFVIGLDSGLHVDDGKGCGLEKADPMLTDLWIADLAAHPSEADTHFLITTADTKGKHSGVWKRKGGTLTPLGMSEPTPAMPNRFPFVASGLRVVPRAASREGVRFLVTGTNYDWSMSMADAGAADAGDASGPTLVTTPVLRISDDLGMTWTTRTLPDPKGSHGIPRFLLVDGSSDTFKALIYLEVGFGEDSNDELDTVLVTKDGGQNFALYSDKLQVAGEAAQLPSGQILLGDRGAGGGGLWSAANFDAAPTKIGDFPVHCLAYQPKTQKLLLCKLNELGYYDVAAKSFCQIFQPNDTSSMVSCPDAPLETNPAVIKQLCGGFCGAAHYASAPVCSTFTPPASGNLCGREAHNYDIADSDPGKRWIEPPGSNAAPRCEGFTGPSRDAGAAGGASDAGAVSREDAAVAAPDASSGGSERDAGSEASEDAGGGKTKGGDGCQLATPGRASAAHAALFGLLALLGGFLARRRLLARGPARAVARR